VKSPSGSEVTPASPNPDSLVPFPWLQDRANAFFAAELGICRKLKNCSGVPKFLGVAGADVYLVWKYEGDLTLEDILRSKNCLSELAGELGTYLVASLENILGTELDDPEMGGRWRKTPRWAAGGIDMHTRYT
jgi:hypothetical protein